MNVLVSACLLGVKCRYDGSGGEHAEWIEAYPKIHLIPVCPEQLGGLKTPRCPAECVKRKGTVHVVTQEGEDVTAAYEKGAAESLRLARLYHCEAAILKERSPSCGSGEIYDGTFTHTRILGDGVTAKCLKEAQIPVYGESAAAEVLERLSRDGADKKKKVKEKIDRK